MQREGKKTCMKLLLTLMFQTGSQECVKKMDQHHKTQFKQIKFFVNLMTEGEDLTSQSSWSRNRQSCPEDSPDSATALPGWAPRHRRHTTQKEEHDFIAQCWNSTE